MMSSFVEFSHLPSLSGVNSRLVCALEEQTGKSGVSKTVAPSKKSLLFYKNNAFHLLSLGGAKGNGVVNESSPAKTLSYKQPVYGEGMVSARSMGSEKAQTSLSANAAKIVVLLIHCHIFFLIFRVVQYDTD